MKSPKQAAILRALSTRGKEGTITLTECVELVGGNLYHNKAKHTGVVLSNMVKRGMLKRIKPGLYGPITEAERGKLRTEPRQDYGDLWSGNELFKKEDAK